MGGHSRFLVQEFGLEQETVRAMREGTATPADLEPRYLVLIDFVRKVAREPNDISETDIDELYERSWTNAEIVEALSIAAFSAFTNTIAKSLHFERDINELGMSGYF